MDGTASAAIYHDPGTGLAADSSPQPSTGSDIAPAGATQDAPWQPLPNRRAGERELAWYEAHRAELGDYERKWIAIKGHEIRVARDTFAEVRAYLDEQGIPDALIVHVRENVGGRQYFID